MGKIGVRNPNPTYIQTSLEISANPLASFFDIGVDVPFMYIVTFHWHWYPGEETFLNLKCVELATPLLVTVPLNPLPSFIRSYINCSLQSQLFNNDFFMISDYIILIRNHLFEIFASNMHQMERSITIFKHFLRRAPCLKPSPNPIFPLYLGLRAL